MKGKNRGVIFSVLCKGLCKVLLTGVVIFLQVGILCGQSLPPHMLNPVRMDIGPDGNVWVTDYTLEMVLTVNPRTNQIIGAFRVSGKPLGIAYAEAYDLILVGNETKSCVDIYKPGGQLVGHLGKPTCTVVKPTDIATDPWTRKVFVADTMDKNIKVFQKTILIGTIPSNDPGQTQLLNPTGVTVNPNSQEVFVSDYGDLAQSVYARIQVFDYDGNLLRTIPGKIGMGVPRFSRPQGLVVAKGRVYLLDCFASEVVILDAMTGEVKGEMGGFGTGPGLLRLPLDLVVDRVALCLCVLNNRDPKIEIFR